MKKFIAAVCIGIITLWSVPSIARTDIVTIVIGFAPGGGSDRIARETQHILETAGKTVIVEYRPGAGGDEAARQVANDASPEIRLLLKGTSNIVMRNLQPNTVYKYTDLQPVVYLGYVPLVLATSPQSHIKTLDDFLKNNKTLTFGSSGVGSGSHLSGEMLFSATAKTMIHVPYRGNSQIMPDLLAGRIDSALIFPMQAKAHVEKNELNAVAVAGSRRVDSMPTVPTLDERGLSQAYGKLKYVLFANPGAPRSQLQEIAQILATALRRESNIQRWRTNADMDIEPNRVLDVQKILDQEFADYNKIVQRNPDILPKR